MERLLAYPLHAIDVLDDGRDEGEERLKRARAVLHAIAAADDNIKTLLRSEAADSLAAMLCPAGNVSVRVATQESFMMPKGERKAVVRLVAPTGRVMSSSTCDLLPDKQRACQCVAVQEDDSVYVLGWPVERLPAPRVRIELDRTLCGGSAQAHSQATLTLVRYGACGVNVDVVTSTGKATTAHKARNLDQRLVDRLFEPFAPLEHAMQLLPRAVGDLPASIAVQIAAYFQTHLRMHVISAVLAPESCSRPMAFRKITCKMEGPTGRQSPVIRALLHSSAATCLCPMHKRQRVEDRIANRGERFLGSNANFTMTMCGQSLWRPNKDGPGECRVHGQNTPQVGALPHICCFGTSVSMGCTHRTANRTSRSGTYVSNMPLNAPNLMHARILLAGAARCVTKTEPLIAARAKPGEIAATCARVQETMAGKLEEVEQMRAEMPDDEHFSTAAMIRNDELATELLRDGGVRQHLPAEGDPVLVLERDGRTLRLSGNATTLQKTHLHLFPRPTNAGGAKRRRW